MANPAGRLPAAEGARWVTAALVLLILLLHGGSAFGHASHQVPMQAAAFHQVTTAPAATWHAGHPGPACCVGAPCVKVVPMSTPVSARALALSMQPAAWPPGRAPAETGRDPSPSPRPPRHGS